MDNINNYLDQVEISNSLLETAEGHKELGNEFQSSFLLLVAERSDRLALEYLSLI